MERSRRGGLARTVAATAAAVLLAGCATGSAGESGRATRSPFAGPLFLAAPSGRHPGWSGAAGMVVRCRVRPAEGGTSTAPYREGAVGRTPAGAIKEAADAVSVSTPLLHLERRDGDRVLYTSVYGGRVVQALVLRHGPSAKGTGADEHGRGWWPESWASCDLADWPEAVSRAQGTEVWSDAAGRRIDTRRVVSWVDNDDNCLGTDEVQVGSRSFVRAPKVGATSYFRERYRRDRRLPADAVDTGWSRDGVHLWLSSLRARAYLGRDPSTVEFWPELVERVGCG